MTNPISLSKEYYIVRTDEADFAALDVTKRQERSLHEITAPAKKAGDYANTLAPYIALQAATFLALNYLRVFTVLSYLNWSLTTYGVPALAAVGADKLAQKMQPVTDTVGTIAGSTVRNVTACAQYAMLNQQDRYYAPSIKQVFSAVNA